MRKQWRWVAAGVSLLVLGLAVSFLFPSGSGRGERVLSSSLSDAGVGGRIPGDELAGHVLFDGADVPDASVLLYPVTALDNRLGWVGDNEVSCGAMSQRALAAAAGESAAPLQRAQTDGQGRFRFKVEKGKRYALSVSSGKLRDVVEEASSGDEWRIHLEPSRPIKGTVRLPNGDAAAGAELSAIAWETGEVVHLRAGDQGDYVLNGIASRQLLMRVQAPGFEPQLVVNPHGTYVLRPAGFKRKVLFEGVGVGGAEIRTSDGRAATSEKDGTFSLDGFPCSTELYFARFAELRARGFTSDPTLELKKPARLTVELSSSVPAQLAKAKIEVGSYDEPGLSPSTQTPSSAIFDDLFPSRWTVEVSAPGLSSLEQKIELEPGEDRVLRMVLEPTVSLEGVVLGDADSKPLEGMTVELASLENAKVSEPNAQTDQRGRFRFAALAPGKYRVWVSNYDYLPVEQEAVTGTEVTLRLERGAKLSGKVSYEGLSRPPGDYAVSVVPNTEVHANDDTWDKARWFVGERRHDVRRGVTRLGRTGVELFDDGRFRSSPLQPGVYRVVVANQGRRRPLMERECEVTAAGDGSCELVVPEGLTITGRVVDEGGRTGVTKIVAYGTDREFTYSSEEDGTFELLGLTSGKWVLSARRESDNLYAYQSAQAGQRDVELRLAATRGLTARFIVHTGKQPTAITIQGRLGERTIRREYTLVGGRLDIELPPGSGEFIFQSGAFRSKPLPFPASGDVALGDVTLE